MTTEPAAPCQNCGSPLYGQHCYACGQPTKGLVRQFSSILGDFFDTVFDVDGRILRTLPALLLKPGFLTREYFDGHRVRYVSPVRLFVFLCIATFFAAKLATPSFDIGRSGDIETGGPRIQLDGAVNEGFESLDSPEAIEARRTRAMADFATARKETAGVPGMDTVFDRAEAEVNAAADARLAALAAPKPKPVTATPAIVIDDDDEGPSMNFNGKPWDAETNPLVFDSLPTAVNGWINAQLGHVPENWKRVREDPDLLRNAFYSALPTALFVLVPVFALLLKGVYLFKRRLYMEHLVTALHGHAFVCAMLLVLMALGAIETLMGSPAWLAAPLGWLEWACLLWIPIYLWLQLKRIYGQGVVMTSLKYAVLGFAEVMLLSVVATGALLAALVWL